MTVDAAIDEAELNGFVDSRMDPVRSATVARSLASDPEARARIEGWRRQNESLRTLFASVLTEPVPIRLVPASHLSREAPLISPSAAGQRAPNRLAGVVAATSIGAALAGFVLGALASMATDGFGSAAPRSVPAAAVDLPLGDALGGLARRAAEAHRAFVVDGTRPVEFTAAEQPKLARWLQRRVGARLRVPDLGPLGWTLVGGRLVPDRRGAAALLIYNDGADRLGLLVSHLPGDGGALSVSDADAPLGIAVWTDGGFSYALTSERGPAWLERNGAGLRSAIAAQMAPKDAGAKP